jgi:hypothetical protein
MRKIDWCINHYATPTSSKVIFFFNFSKSVFEAISGPLAWNENPVLKLDSPKLSHWLTYSNRGYIKAWKSKNNSFLYWYGRQEEARSTSKAKLWFFRIFYTFSIPWSQCWAEKSNALLRSATIHWYTIHWHTVHWHHDSLTIQKSVGIHIWGKI